MTTDLRQVLPPSYTKLLEATQQLSFTMASDVLTCSMLRTLAASKPSGKFLELGTGTGLSTVWILDGMDSKSTLVSIDNDEKLLNVASEFLSGEPRLKLFCGNGENWIEKNQDQKFDYIFADTWPGKYNSLEPVLNMLNPGGLYIIDDMLPQANWPEGHQQKALDLVEYLESRTDFMLTKLHWSTGIIIAVKR